MAVQMSATYMGDDQVDLVHGPSGSHIKTDLPVDNGGQGRTFSPTDLFCSSLASCILTIMAKAAERDGFDVKGLSIKVEKEMREKPRQIARIFGTVSFPKHLAEKERKKLMAYIEACPVHRSLHPDVKVELTAD